MKPRPITEADLAYWVDHDPRPVMFTAPGEVEDGIDPAPGLITNDIRGRYHTHDVHGEQCDDTTCRFLHVVMKAPGEVCRVAIAVDDIEVAHLAKGGTLWLSTWGSLPVFMLEVQEP